MYVGPAKENEGTTGNVSFFGTVQRTNGIKVKGGGVRKGMRPRVNLGASPEGKLCRPI